MKKLGKFLASAGVLLFASRLALAAPEAPPLPAGSEKAVVEVGESPSERARSMRAHKRPIKDKSRDDTLPDVVNPVATTPPVGADSAHGSVNR